MSEKWIKTWLGGCCKAPQYGLNAAAVIYDGKHGYLRITDIDDESHSFIKSGLTSPDHYSEDYRLYEGDLLLARTGASVGKSYLYHEKDGDLYFAGFMIRFTATENFDAGYLFYQTQTSDYWKWVANVSERTGQPGINSQEYCQYRFYAPFDLSAQRHIAEVLSTCDEVIEQSERAAEKYRQIKAGMLKDLLTRGIDNRGRLRPPPSVAPELYKDSELGSIPREWEVKRLGDVCQAPQYGLNVAATEYDGIHGYIRITDIDDNSHRFNHGGITSPENYSDFYKLEEGDIVISRTGASVGKAYVYDRRDGLLYFAGFLIRFRCNRDVDSRFVFSQLLTGRYWNWVAAMSVRTGQPGINSQEYAKYRFAMPMEAPEQRAIAERLAAVDERIAAEVKTAEKYRKVKAGLMEKLLTPPVDAEIEDMTQEVAG